MAQQQLDGPDVGAGFEQMHREGMPQGVGGDGFGKAGPPTGRVARATDRPRGDRVSRPIAWEEPLLRTIHPPPRVLPHSSPLVWERGGGDRYKQW